MIKWLKMIFCFHKFKWDDDYDVMATAEPHFVCVKCGKKEGL